MDCAGAPVRILWISNAPWSPSGYGEQAALFLPRLRALGHEIAVVCNFGLQGTRMDWKGFTCYPSDNLWANTSLHTYAEHFKADLVLILHDAWVMKPTDWPDGPPVAIWAPVDHYPLPPAVLAVLSHERIRPIAMSRFGEEQMQAFGLDPLYIPHGVDTKVFQPRPELRDQVRDGLDIPRDAFLVGMVAANKGNPSIPRKSFPQAFDAFARFARKHEDAWMYVHTEATPASGNGIDLDVLARITGCPVGRLRFPPAEVWHMGLPNTHVAALYNAFDVFLNPAMGEGFGVPIIEAQACGVPAIVSDHSAMSEIGREGWLIGGDPWWDALQTSFLISPSIGAIEGALESAYELRDNQDLRDAALTLAREYDADRITETYWKPALDKLSGRREVGPLTSTRGERRRQARAAGKAVTQ